MSSYTLELEKIKEILSSDTDGLSVKDISERINVNRNSVAKYMDVLETSSKVYKKLVGPTKLYFLNKEAPITRMIDYSKDMIVIVNEKQIILDCNISFLEFLKADKEDMVGKQIEKTNAINILPFSKDKINKAMEGIKLSYEFEYHFDESIYFNVHYIPIITKNDNTVAILIENITDKKNAEIELNEKNKLLSYISYISSKFINLPFEETDTAIKNAVQEIGQLVNADRSYIFLFNDDGITMNNTHEWCGKGINAEINNLQNLPISVFQWSITKLQRFENVIVPRVADLPLEAKNEKKILQEQSIQSLVLVPIVYSHSLKGFIGFDAVSQEKHWSDQVAKLLRVVGEVIINAIIRGKNEERSNSDKENYRNFFSIIDDLIFIGDPTGKIFYTNNAVSRKLGYSSEELLGMHILDVHPDDKRTEAETIFGEMFQGKRVVCPLPLKKKDGGIIPVETRIWFGKWDGKECIYGISKDLSIEQEALQKFNKLFQNNPALMVVSSPDGRIIDVNDSYLKLLKYTREEVIGNTSDGLNIFVNVEEKNKVKKILGEQGKIKNVKLKIRTKDNKIVTGIFSGEVIESQGKKYFLTVMTCIDLLVK